MQATTIQYKDAKGRLVTQTTELRFTRKELEIALSKSEKDSLKLSEVEKQLVKVGKLAKELQIRNKDIEEVNLLNLEVISDSMTTEIVYKENKVNEIKPIKTKHLSVNFKVIGDSVYVNTIYNTDLSVVGYRKVDKFTKKGNKRFFVARWFVPRWQYEAKAVAEDKNASLKITNIDFKKKNGN